MKKGFIFFERMEKRFTKGMVRRITYFTKGG